MDNEGAEDGAEEIDVGVEVDGDGEGAEEGGVGDCVSTIGASAIGEAEG